MSSPASLLLEHRPEVDGRYRYSRSVAVVRPAPIISIPNVPETRVVHAPAGEGTLIVRRRGVAEGWVRRWT